MKLDVRNFRYITKDEFRVLTALEMGMRNHELVPAPLVESIAKVSRGSCFKLLQTLLRHKLVAHDGKKYDGYRLTYHGYDFLAIRALAMRGSISCVGRRLGVGKESDVHYAQGPNGELLALKLHRLGRISFRNIKEKRDYLKGREHASWMYMARLAAVKEFAYMKALGDEGFPVPHGVDQNRHVVVMSFIKSTPLYHMRHLNKPSSVLERLMRLLVRLARAGVVHGDFNEFNLMIDEDEKVTLIDFPQLVHSTHVNAEDYFDRDVMGVREFFRKRLNIEVSEWPTWGEAILGAGEADDEAAADAGAEAGGSASAALLRTGAIEGLRAEDDALLVAAHEHSRTQDGASGERGGENEDDDDDDDSGEEEDDDEAGGEDEKQGGRPGQEEENRSANDADRGTGDGAQVEENCPGFQALTQAGGSIPGVEEEALEEAALQASNANPDGGEGCPREQDDADEAGEDDEDSEASEGPGQVAVAGKRRTRRKQTAKDARKNLQKEQKQKPARANNQKSKEFRKAKADIKEYLG